MIKIKQIKLKLTDDNKAIILNDPIFIETDETVEFVVTNGDGELFYSTGKENIEINDGKFVMTYIELRSLEKLNIIVKEEGKLYPTIYMVEGLKLHDVTVLGRTVDEKYPNVIKDLYSQIETLGRAVIDLYNRFEEKEKEGVIE